MKWLIIFTIKKQQYEKAEKLLVEMGFKKVTKINFHILISDISIWIKAQ